MFFEKVGTSGINVERNEHFLAQLFPASAGGGRYGEFFLVCEMKSCSSSSSKSSSS